MQHSVTQRLRQASIQSRLLLKELQYIYKLKQHMLVQNCKGQQKHIQKIITAITILSAWNIRDCTGKTIIHK